MAPRPRAARSRHPPNREYRPDGEQPTSRKCIEYGKSLTDEFGDLTVRDGVDQRIVVESGKVGVLGLDVHHLRGVVLAEEHSAGHAEW
jgi:hypothetical protein